MSEEAALDLGASHATVIRRILPPHLDPATAAAIAFFQPIEKVNTTLFTRGIFDKLTVSVLSSVRSGIILASNALAVILVPITPVGVTWYEITRRRNARKFVRPPAA